MDWYKRYKQKEIYMVCVEKIEKIYKHKIEKNMKPPPPSGIQEPYSMA